MGKKIQFKVTLKSGSKTVAEVTGIEMDPNGIRVGDIIDLESTMERVTGLRCHVEMIDK